jgi:hypothetical protein
LEANIGRLRERKQQLETEVNDLQSVIRFNEEMFADEALGAIAQAARTDGRTLLANSSATRRPAGPAAAPSSVTRSRQESTASRSSACRRSPRWPNSRTRSRPFGRRNASMSGPSASASGSNAGAQNSTTKSHRRNRGSSARGATQRADRRNRRNRG